MGDIYSADVMSCVSVWQRNCEYEQTSVGQH